jgi:hypothetical protein
MALTIPVVLHSLYGRVFGVNRQGYAISKGWIEPYESSTAASTLADTGTSLLSGSTADFTLAAPPFRGVTKEIINASSVSTATMGVVRSTANGACSFLPCTSGTTAGGDSTDVKRLNLLQVGSAVRLRAISTSQWAVVSIPASSLYFTISTSS